MSERTDLHVVPGELLPPRTPERRHLLSVADLDRDDVERLLATARSFALSQERDDEEAADAARPARRQRLLRVVDAHLVVVRAGREAALGRHALDQGERLVGRQGRVAQGHGAHALGLRPGRDRDPPSADRRAAARRARHRGARRERRRRQAPASDPGAARPLHDPGVARPARRACTSRSSATSSTRASRARSSRRCGWSARA